MPLINEHDHLIFGFYRSCIGRNYDVFMYMKDLVTVYNMDPQIPYTEMFRHNIYSDKICKELEKFGAKPNKDIFERALLMNFYKYIIRFPNEYKDIDDKYYREFDVEIIKFLYLNSKRITFYELTGFRGYYAYRKRISCSISCRFNSKLLRIQNFKILFNNHLQKKI